MDEAASSGFGSLLHPYWRESEAQLTKKQAVLLMHNTLPQGIKSICTLLQNQKRLTIWHITLINFVLTITGHLRGDKLTCLTINFILIHRE